MGWQGWVTIILIAAAVLYLARRWWPRRRPEDGGDQADCGTCCSECEVKVLKDEACQEKEGVINQTDGGAPGSDNVRKETNQ